MEPVNFHEQCKMFAENQPEYLKLPVFVADTIGGPDMFISCWRLSLWERVKLLFTKDIYLSILGNQPPIILELDSPEFVGIAQ